jgi:hypothetical protein
MSAILTSKHCLHQHQIYYLRTRTTDMVLYIPSRGVLRLKVHDAHLFDFRLEGYRDIHT